MDRAPAVPDPTISKGKMVRYTDARLILELRHNTRAKVIPAFGGLFGGAQNVPY
jgi:hypothetical protein